MDVGSLIQRIYGEGRTELTDVEASTIFKEIGIEIVETRLTSSAAEAVAAADELGYPVVMKVASPQILHKTDANCVLTNLLTAGSVEQGFEEIMSNARRFDPGAEIIGITVQRMVPRGIEVIVGALRDPIFGPAVMFGLGGIWIELMKDVSYRLAPVTREAALEMMEEIQGKPLLTSFRGGDAVDREALADIIIRISELISEHPEISEIDANPIFARPKGAISVDARIVLERPEDVQPVTSTVPSTSDEGGSTSEEDPISAGTPRIKGIFEPTDVAVIGSRTIVEEVGMTSPELVDGVLHNLEKFFEGEVRFVDYPTVEITATSMAIIILPPEESLAAAEACAKAGTRNIIQITGGFTQEQRSQYLELRDVNDLNLLGPNTIMGVLNTDNGLNTTFERDLMPKPGGITVLSQSGGVGAALLDWAACNDIGIGKFTFMGDKLDIDDIEVLEYLENDESTRVIAMYMEGIKDGRRFVETAGRIVKKKPIVVLKGGISEEGAQRAVSHTASVSGSDDIFDAAFQDAGIIRVETIEDLFLAAVALEKQPPMKGNRIAIVSNVGGPAILTADAVERSDLVLAKIPEDIRHELMERYPGVDPLNPIDLIADARSDRFADVLETVLADDGVDGALVINMMKSCFFKPEDLKGILDVVEKSDKPVVDVVPGGEDYNILAEELKGTSLPIDDLPERGVKALEILHHRGRTLERWSK